MLKNIFLKCCTLYFSVCVTEGFHPVIAASFMEMSFVERYNMIARVHKTDNKIAYRLAGADAWANEAGKIK